ncbi:non-ribosomal peptide synthetase [Fibrella aestuarina]|nr:amino acid adenylation domain-containing protein [Fibrella aestuarina]
MNSQPAQSCNTFTPSYDTSQSVCSVLAETARRFTSRMALRFADDTLTYQDLQEQANRVAHALLAMGIQRGDRVGLAIDRSLPLIASMLGILKAGAAYVPVDPQHPTDRITYSLTDAGCVVLLTSAAHQGRFALPGAREVVIDAFWPTLATYPATPPTQAPSGDDLAYILYTSGTTGRPKGVPIRHHSLVNLLLSLQQEPGLLPTDRVALTTTIAFDVSMAEIFLPLLVGAEAVMVDAATMRNAEQLATLLTDETITCINTTPSTLRMLLAVGWPGNKNLRIITAGEALPLDLARQLTARCRDLWNYYGPTEATVYVTGKQILPTDDRITIGFPIANTRIYIIDEAGQLATDGQAGEICIAGAGVADGYYNRPELTAEKFIDNPFSDEPDRLYRTGDLGRYLNGNSPKTSEVYYMGRLDHQVKMRGYRIELGEIEHQLTQLASIRAAAVVAHEDTLGEKQLVAYVVPELAYRQPAGTEQTTAVAPELVRTWRQQLGQHVPDYMVPGAFVVLPELPLTPNGKIDRKALPAPTTGQRTHRLANHHTLTPDEALVANIWAQVLPTELLSLDDNFFELGGNSMIAVQVMARLEKQTGRRLPLASLFQFPTIRALAGLLQADADVISWKSLVPIRSAGSREPLYIVHGAGLNVLLFNAVAQHLHPDQPVFGLQARGLNGIDKPFRTITEMASAYIDEIVQHNPSGPYSLSGFSFGGIVAYEMARQLQEQGRNVSLIALFDTYAHDAGGTHSGLRVRGQAVGLNFMKLRHTLQLVADQGVRQAARYKMEAVDQRFIRQYWRVKDSRRPDHWLRRRLIRSYWNLRFGGAQQQEALFDTTFRIEAINAAALKQFVLMPANLTVHLFRATIQTFYLDDYAHYGWTNYALGGVHVHDVPGEHSYIFAPPNDKAFAVKLQAVLDTRHQ